MFGAKRRSKKSRAEPVGVMIASGGEVILPDGYVSLASSEEVRRCAHIIADTVSNMTLMLMKNGDNGDERIKNELSKKLDIYPSKHMTRKTFIYGIVQEMVLGGNAIVLPKISANAFIEDLQIVPYGSYSLIPNGDSYLVQIKGKQYQPDEILHFPLNPSRAYPWKGEGYSRMILKTLKNVAQANATKTKFLQSKWQPSIIISVDSDVEEMLDPEKRDKLLENYLGNAESGKPWIIPAGEISVEKIQPLTLKDLAIQESIELDIKSVASTIRIPPFMVGIGDFNKEAHNNFIATTVMSFATIIQQEFSNKLIVAGDMYTKFNANSLYQYSLTEKTTFVKEMTNIGVMNRNEGRAEFDRSPVDDEGMNDYTTLENYLKVNDLSKQKKLEQGGEGNE